MRLTGLDALVYSDVGGRLEPTAQEWNAWVAAGKTRNWVLGDPLLDWLRLYGSDVGFPRDDERPDYDERTDFLRFVLAQGSAFETAVMRLLAARTEVVRVAHDRHDARSLVKAQETVEALRSGVPIVAQAVLRNPERQTYGIADLLVRSDLLAEWWPDLLAAQEAIVPAPGLALEGFHYRVLDIKFHSLDVGTDGQIGYGGGQGAYAVQIWLYAEALARVQGYRAPASYLLGRNWKDSHTRGIGAFERLGRIDHDHVIARRNLSLATLADEAVRWIRRVRADGATWQVLPLPSVPELYPHARNLEDAPWHGAKHQIAEALAELTLLPAMNPQLRGAAHAAGIRSWKDPGLTAAMLGITSATASARCDAVLAANRLETPGLLPAARLAEASPEWRNPAPVEFYVDFETVSNMADDFADLPAPGGHAQIAMIGCGHLDLEGEWQFSQWTVNALTDDEERWAIDQWIDHMRTVAEDSGTALEDCRVYHWSPAETSNLDTAYNSARVRHPDAVWPVSLPWFDLLERVIRAEPVTVTGAFGFGLKAVTKAMHAAGLIPTEWGEGPTDGLGAMVGTWSAATACLLDGRPMSEHPLMADISAYNEVDCRAMVDVLAWLRLNR